MVGRGGWHSYLGYILLPYYYDDYYYYCHHYYCHYHSLLCIFIPISDLSAPVFFETIFFCLLSESPSLHMYVFMYMYVAEVFFRNPSPPPPPPLSLRLTVSSRGSKNFLRAPSARGL